MVVGQQWVRNGHSIHLGHQHFRGHRLPGVMLVMLALRQHDRRFRRLCVGELLATDDRCS